MITSCVSTLLYVPLKLGYFVMTRRESEFEFHSRVAEEIESMPLITQGIIELRYIQGFDLDFIADELGISEIQARNLAETALSALKDRVTGSG